MKVTDVIDCIGEYVRMSGSNILNHGRKHGWTALHSDEIFTVQLYTFTLMSVHPPTIHHLPFTIYHLLWGRKTG